MKQSAMDFLLMIMKTEVFIIAKMEKQQRIAEMNQQKAQERAQKEQEAKKRWEEDEKRSQQAKADKELEIQNKMRLQKLRDQMQNENAMRMQRIKEMETEEKEKQEKISLLNIDDSFKKIIITGEPSLVQRDNDGITTMSIYDFLLNDNSLEI